MFDKLNKIDQLYAQSLLDKCKGCDDIDNCKQEMIGLVPTTTYDENFDTYSLAHKKCKYARGKTNTILIKNYETWEASNKVEIMNHVKSNWNIFLHGDVGLGKTHFLYWLANQINKQGRNIHIDYFGNIVKKVKSEFNRKMEQGEQSHTEYLQNVDYLFIDDLGSETKSEFNVSDILLPIIDYRYVNKKPTFISSNYSLSELYSMYGSVIKGDYAQKQVRPLISRLKTFGELEIKSKNWRI